MSNAYECAPAARSDGSVHPSLAHHVFDYLAIHNGAFFSEERFVFHPGFNCLLGSIGSGKTTVLQSLRHGVGVPATDPRAEQNHKQVIATLGDGELEVGVTSGHGKKLVGRRCGEEPVQVTTGVGEPAAVSLDGDLFRIEFYAQNQIFTMAEDKRAQLALIDKFALPEIRTLSETIADANRRLEANDAHLTRLAGEIEDGTARTADLGSVSAALEALGQIAGPDAAEGQRAHAARVMRGREQVFLQTLREEQRAAIAAANTFEATLEHRLGSALPGELAGSPNHDVLAEAHAESARVLGAAREAMARLRSAIAGAESATSLAADKLGVVHAAQERDYDALAKKLDLDRSRMVERDRLQRRFLELETAQRRLEAQRIEHAARAAERKALIDERAKALAARYAVRRRVAQEITASLDGDLVVDIVAGGEHDDYLVLLTELTRGIKAKVGELLEAIAAHIHPTDFVELVREGDVSAIVALDKAKTNRADRAQKLIDALRASGRLAELEAATLGDVTTIKLKVDEELVESSALSIGERCTAILPILLLQSVSVLIIDQPEDQVGNAYIYRVLVRTLRKVKAHRQIIFASHNPNIVVLGEADRVFILQARNRKGRLKAFGGLDEQRELIEEHVEGGREAFLLRSERYGHR